MLPKIFLKDIRLMVLSQIAKDELVGLRNAIYQLQLHDVDTVHESFLPFLAWIYRADGWSNDWPIERKRSVVKNALLLFKYKGTIWAVERALELSMFDATVVPWYAMMPEGARGTFRIDAAPSDSRSLVQSDYDTLIALTESNKQGSQHWKGNIIHDPNLGSAYAAPVIRTRKRWVSNSIVPLHVTGIVISPTSIIVYEGEPVSVSATVQMSDGTTNHDVRFESSDKSIVTVDEVGLVSFVSEGNASVYAISTFNNISSAECVITALHAITPTAISINEHEPLYVSETGQFTATVTYSDSNVISTIDDPTIVSWSTSDASIVTIDEDGNYTVNAAGDVTITATSTEDSAITDVVNITTTIDYDFVLTVGHPSTSYFYYGYSQSNYGNVEPNAWGDSKHAIIGLGAHTEGSSPAIYPLSFSCDAMDLWNDLQNIKLKFFTETEFVESPASNGFRYTQSGAYTFDDAMDVYVLLRENVDKSVYVKVLEAPSTEINNSIEMTVGAYSDSSFNVYGYRSSSNTGAMAGKFNSGSSITTCYVRDAYYGMVIQSEVKNEYWNGWEYMHATWEFEDGTSHVYAGRLLMHSGQGFYTSSVIDDELITLAQNNLDKSVTVTFSQSETPSNVIEIEIGEVEISTGDIAYGLRTSSSTGSLISGEFPDASPVANAYVRTKGFGCLIGGAFERSYWNYQSTIAVTWEFEDGTTYEYPEALEYSYNSTSSESFYESSYIDDTLIAMISSRVGQTAKITVTTPSTSKFLTHLYWDYLHWELDDSAKV